MKKYRGFGLSSTLFLIGVSLISLAFFGPDTAGPQVGSFFRMAAAATWGNWLNLAAAWCSCKIILLSLGLFLVIECLGTFLAVSGRRHLAWAVYALHLLPGLGFLTGSYYLIKALL
ncbi:MAG: hypothetical protein WCH99_08295 [Verrucomicrobiota bacterium]